MLELTGSTSATLLSECLFLPTPAAESAFPAAGVAAGVGIVLLIVVVYTQRKRLSGVAKRERLQNADQMPQMVMDLFNGGIEVPDEIEETRLGTSITSVSTRHSMTSSGTSADMTQSGGSRTASNTTSGRSSVLGQLANRFRTSSGGARTMSRHTTTNDSIASSASRMAAPNVSLRSAPRARPARPPPNCRRRRTTDCTRGGGL